MTKKICIDCKYHKLIDGVWAYDNHWCTVKCSPIPTVDPVTGTEYKHAGSHKCYDMRQQDAECGPEGKLWEAKEC
jgi:hypothetical protein